MKLRLALLMLLVASATPARAQPSRAATPAAIVYYTIAQAAGREQLRCTAKRFPDAYIFGAKVHSRDGSGSSLVAWGRRDPGSYMTATAGGAGVVEEKIAPSDADGEFELTYGLSMSGRAVVWSASWGADLRCELVGGKNKPKLIRLPSSRARMALASDFGTGVASSEAGVASGSISHTMGGGELWGLFETGVVPGSVASPSGPYEDGDHISFFGVRGRGTWTFSIDATVRRDDDAMLRIVEVPA